MRQKKYLSDEPEWEEPVPVESGETRIGEIMDEYHVSRRHAQDMIDHGQREI